MSKNVTIQDLANALGMSRNTVSKALNGQYVPIKTRNAVLSAAIDMGYKSYKLAASSEGSSILQKRFLILSSRLLMNINYYIYVLRGIEEALTDKNIELLQFTVSNSTSFLKFKRYIESNKVDGIICIEFYETQSIPELIDMGIPLVFLDLPFSHLPSSGHYDIVLPESHDAVMDFCIHLIKENFCKTFGFVGDFVHCHSFFERYTGMRDALFLSGLEFDSQYSIMHDDSQQYSSEALKAILKEKTSLPDCFVAANDTIALNLMAALKSLKVHIPREVRVIGFDNYSDSKNSVPPLTTFNVNKSALGKQTISILLDRISHPTRPNYVVHIASKLIIRSST